VFVDLHALLQQYPSESEDQFCGVEQGVVAFVEQAAEGAGGVDVVADLVGVEVVVAVRRVVGLLQLFDLPVLEGEGDFPGAFEVAVDAEAGDRLLDRVEVRQSELVEPGGLVGKVVDAVGDPVGEAGGAESAVSAGRRPAGLGPFEEDDVAGAPGGGVLRFVLCLVLFDGLEGGPQAGEAAADDDEVGGGVPRSGGCGSGGSTESSQYGVVEAPVRAVVMCGSV
jgi:hypothetical protein